MEFLQRLANGQVSKETAYMDFVTELNKAATDIKSKNSKTSDNAFHFLDFVAFNLKISFNHKLTALETLLTHVEYHTVADKVALLIQDTTDIYDKSNLIAITKRYRKIDHSVVPTDPAGLIEHARGLWKQGILEKATTEFETVLTHEQASVQEKITVIHTMINDCYNPEQKEAMATVLSPIYTFLQYTPMSYASVRDILTGIFRLRNTNLQRANTRIFKQHMDVWASSIDTYTAGTTGSTFYIVNKAWTWVCDAIEFARPAGKETLWSYLATWITDPPFNEELPPREKYKYQFFACEFLLQSYRIEEQRIATDFLLAITESTDYSTFVRGDALDVLLRNPVPREYRDQVEAARGGLRVVREDTERNQILQAVELGQAAVIDTTPQFTPAITGTVYDDSQNVHDTAVNEAIKESLLNLSKDPEVRGNTVYKVSDDITDMINKLDTHRTTQKQRSRAKAALARFIEDPAVFTEKRIKLGLVLVLVWNRICRHRESSEMHIRLVQELAEAFNTCASGHLSRIVSVLVGYCRDIKQFAGFETQLVNNIKARINSEIRKAPEELQGDLFIAMADNKCEEYQVYIDFLKDLYTPIYKELHHEFVPEYISKQTFDRIFAEEWPQ